MKPLSIDLHKKKVVIVGGGRVAEKRLRSLLSEGPEMTVISPELTEALRQLWEQGVFEWKQKTYFQGDASGAFLLITAADQPEVNEQAAAESGDVPLLNRADNGGGNVHFPAHMKRGRLSVSITTNGASPKLTAEIKQRFEEQFPEDYGSYVDFLFALRNELRHAGFSSDRRRFYLEEGLKEACQSRVNQQSLLEEIHKEKEADDCERTGR
ncbi:NAD(P)-binding protein [Halobacillus kuroshimensis]|uniref:precorrin-2 dehydrogenase n=1 Tax=Halobacillus kuroshimensis TaxID=302481 RepID=A0ABS3DSV4_9BACI|nr:NAD(P)-dependent oxidoreductase [Halobacillus sp. Cin3]MBN8234406.1 NAD(P)-binding protein [Halobacillus kuroshimensis]